MITVFGRLSGKIQFNEDDIEYVKIMRNEKISKMECVKTLRLYGMDLSYAMKLVFYVYDGYLDFA